MLLVDDRLTTVVPSKAGCAEGLIALASKALNQPGNDGSIGVVPVPTYKENP